MAKPLTEVRVHPRTYELIGLALAGICAGFLLPYWVPGVVGSVADQAFAFVGIARGLTLDQYVGLGFWFGTLLVVRGFLRRRRRRVGGGEP